MPIDLTPHQWMGRARAAVARHLLAVEGFDGDAERAAQAWNAAGSAGVRLRGRWLRRADELLEVLPPVAWQPIAGSTGAGALWMHNGCGATVWTATDEPPRDCVPCSGVSEAWTRCYLVGEPPAQLGWMRSFPSPASPDGQG